MGYLSDEEIESLSKVIETKDIKECADIKSYKFDSGVQEYNDFLNLALGYDALNISKTHLFVHRETNELIGYMTLSTDSIKLNDKEKTESNLSTIPFCSLPALKVGKLAINKKLSDGIKRKGYGSYLLVMAQAMCYKLNSEGVACKFLTVDADIEYDKDTVEFYKKNGFKENLALKSRNAKYTISMRLPLYEE